MTSYEHQQRKTTLEVSTNLEFMVGEPHDVPLSVSDLVDWFSATVCRYPNEFQGKKRTQAIGVFMRKLETLDTTHAYLAMTDDEFMAVVCTD